MAEKAAARQNEGKKMKGPTNFLLWHGTDTVLCGPNT
jgi:hypothetical protein